MHLMTSCEKDAVSLEATSATSAWPQKKYVRLRSMATSDMKFCSCEKVSGARVGMTSPTSPATCVKGTVGFFKPSAHCCRPLTARHGLSHGQCQRFPVSSLAQKVMIGVVGFR